MGLSAALRPYLPAMHYCHSSKLFPPKINLKQVRFAFNTTAEPRNRSVKIISSVLSSSESSVNGNGGNEPARILLERLFVQTHKLEEQMNRDSHFPEKHHLWSNLEVLESDLLAVLEALKKKEEDLQGAEEKVLLERSELNYAKHELERREKEITATSTKHEELENELKHANLNLASQAKQIEDLKLQFNERDQEIASAKSALALKEDLLSKIINEFEKKCDEAATIDSELKYNVRLLDAANEVVKKQELQLHVLKKTVQEKEQELESSLTLRKLEEEKLEVARANLEKLTIDWLLAQEELKKMSEEASKRMIETNETLQDFQRVKKLLADVRSEFISSQKSLAFSRKKVKEQEEILEKQLSELEEHRKSINSYVCYLKNAQVEIESERVKFRAMEVQNKELEHNLAIDKEHIEDLEDELRKKKSSLKHAIDENSFLKQELERRSTEFEEMHGRLLGKESEFVEVKLELQHLKSEQASLKLVLEERDLQLFDARKKFEELNQEVMELKALLSNKEHQLLQATSMLKDKEKHVQMMQDELNDSRMKVSEAEIMVEQIAELTNKLVISVKDEYYNVLGHTDDLNLELMQQPTDDLLRREQLETELKLTKESLKMKEKEVLATQRARAIKDEELKRVLVRLDGKEKELKRLKEEIVEDANDLRKLYTLAQERIGEKSIGELAIEQLQLEAAQLEVEAATTALNKLVGLSGELLNKASLTFETDIDASIPQNAGLSVSETNDEYFKEVDKEVTRLSALTEQLLKEAGVVVRAN